MISDSLNIFSKGSSHFACVQHDVKGIEKERSIFKAADHTSFARYR